MEQAIAASTINPAKAMGLENEIGDIRRGLLADMLVVTSEFELKEVYIGGKKLSVCSRLQKVFPDICVRLKKEGWAFICRCVRENRLRRYKQKWKKVLAFPFPLYHPFKQQPRKNHAGAKSSRITRFTFHPFFR